MVDLCNVGKPKYEIMVECDVAKSVMGWLVRLFGAAGPQHAVDSRTLDRTGLWSSNKISGATAVVDAAAAPRYLMTE